MTGLQYTLQMICQTQTMSEEQTYLLYSSFCSADACSVSECCREFRSVPCFSAWFWFCYSILLVAPSSNHSDVNQLLKSCFCNIGNIEDVRKFLSVDIFL